MNQVNHVIINKSMKVLRNSLHLKLFVSYQVALKTLIVIHRTLREGDPTFREELVNFQQRGRVLQLANFKDDSSPIGIFFDLFSTYNLNL